MTVRNSAATLIVIALLTFVALFGYKAFVACSTIFFKEDLTLTVTKTYVDTSKGGSHYMVATDKGMFEIDNGPSLGYSADMLFGSLTPNNTYKVRVKGVEAANIFSQTYRYITGVTLVTTASVTPAATGSVEALNLSPGVYHINNLPYTITVTDKNVSISTR